MGQLILGVDGGIVPELGDIGAGGLIQGNRGPGVFLGTKLTVFISLCRHNVLEVAGVLQHGDAILEMVVGDAPHGGSHNAAALSVVGSVYAGVHRAAFDNGHGGSCIGI